MNIKNLKLKNFRNYSTLETTFNINTNILVGDNAQGKTSVLESIYILGLTKSHKVNKDRDTIKIHSEFAKINAVINLDRKDIELDIILSKLGKKAKYNGIELDKLSEYIGLLNVVMFAPEDLDLVKGNPQTRRKFLDLEIGQISKEYLYNLQNYKKILKQRNDLLKTMQKQKESDMLLLDIITDQLIDYLIKIVEQRKQFILEINSIANQVYKVVSNSDSDLKIEYLPNTYKNIKKEFVAKYQYDIITGTTNLGVHRDDIEFILRDSYVKTHASQGELRTTVLAVKLALVEFIKKHKGEYPVLLLDDVLSELDLNRQNNLIKYINDKIQTFITTTEVKNIDLSKLSNYSLYKIHDGQIKESDTYGTNL
jgi:DNA replication and repair protein RecF